MFRAGGAFPATADPGRLPNHRSSSDSASARFRRHEIRAHGLGPGHSRRRQRSMLINTNIMALNAYNNLQNTQMDLSSSLEKLSSGYRINKAADDASGLVISENLKSQVSGLQQATAQRPGRHLGRADRRRCAVVGAVDAAAHPRPRDRVGQHRRQRHDGPPGGPERDRAAPRRDRPDREHDVVRQPAAAQRQLRCPGGTHLQRDDRPRRRRGRQLGGHVTFTLVVDSGCGREPERDRDGHDRHVRHGGVVPGRAPDRRQRADRGQRRLHRLGHGQRA